MPELSDRQKQLREDFVSNRGYWSPLWQQVLELSPEFFEAYSGFSSVPWKHGPLAPKVKELIYVAANIATNHLYLPGARTHMANALEVRRHPRGDPGSDPAGQRAGDPLLHRGDPHAAGRAGARRPAVRRLGGLPG